MNRNTVFNLLAAAIILLASSGAMPGNGLAQAAQSPAAAVAAPGTSIPYTAALSDSAGNPREGAYDFTFTLYASQSDSQALWSEMQSGVAVVGGIFSVFLGEQSTLPSDVLELAEAWLSVAVRGPGEGSFTLLEPRQQITAPAGGESAASPTSLTGSGACPHDHFGDRWAGASNGYALRIENTSNDGISVYSAGGYGVSGTAAANDKSGIRGYNNSAGYGVWGSSTSGTGVYGQASAVGANGVWGENSGDGYGVFGYSENSYGVFGSSAISSGVVGQATADGVSAVYGSSSGTGGTGVQGYSPAGYGVGGGSTNGVGVMAYSTNGIALDVSGTGQIRSSADHVLYLSPHDLVLRMDESSLASITPLQGGGVRVRNLTGTGYRYVSLPFSTFGTLFGSQLYVKSLEVCYKTPFSGSFTYITATTVSKNNGSASGEEYYIYDTTSRTNPSYECYSLSASTPYTPIDNSSWVQFNLTYGGSGSDIYIYTVKLTLTEYDH